MHVSSNHRYVETLHFVYVATFCLFMLSFSNFVLGLFRFRHKDHLVRVRKQFGLLGLVATAGKSP